MENQSSMPIHWFIIFRLRHKWIAAQFLSLFINKYCQPMTIMATVGAWNILGLQYTVGAWNILDLRYTVGAWNIIGLKYTVGASNILGLQYTVGPETF